MSKRTPLSVKKTPIESKGEPRDLLLLWINKIFLMSPDTSDRVTDVICALSNEFSSHRHEVKISFQPCSHGPTHRKVRERDLTFPFFPPSIPLMLPILVTVIPHQ